MVTSVWQAHGVAGKAAVLSPLCPHSAPSPQPSPSEPRPGGRGTGSDEPLQGSLGALSPPPSTAWLRPRTLDSHYGPATQKRSWRNYLTSLWFSFLIC